ncbi:MAG: molybdopterin synthase sulfur carrier subunit [Armatimonadetes bacterium]|nr:molybdopterin synthase sulfur carrier subunit [Armatimonadota bacterium]
MAIVHVPEPLRRAAGKPEALSIPGSTVREVLKNLAAQWPECSRALWADEERLAAGVAVFVGITPIRVLGGLNAAIEEGAEVFVLLPLLVGG